VIDIHCHVLPFLDDGAPDWEASLSMARAAVQDGIQQCIATPHWTGGPDETAAIRERAEEFRQRLTDAGLGLKVHLGNEVILVPKLVEALKEGRALTLGGSSYVLLETAQLETGAYTHSALFQLQSAGYRVILAHPERVRSWLGYLGELRELLQRGCFAQVNAASLVGGFGKSVQRAAEELVRLGWISILASDAHSPTKRPQLMGPAVKRCTQLIGAERAHALVHTNPARVLCNEQLPYIDMEDPPRRRFPWWPFGPRSE
jgi:protein-tyrosine phosphatase